MSASFTNLVLAQLDLWTNRGRYEKTVSMLPKHLDEEVARLHLGKLGVKLTELTPEQARYIGVPIAPQRCEALGECPAEAASGPGDQGDLVLQRTGLCHGLLIELSRRSRLSLPWRGLAGKPGNPLASQSLPCRVRQPMIAPGREPTRTTVNCRDLASTFGFRDLEAR
jgi:hypothetical protein